MAKLLVPESISGESTYLINEPASEGMYHGVVLEVFEGEKPTKNGTKLFDGICAVIEILSGPNNSVGKKYTLSLTDPKPSHSDGGEACAAKQANLLIATDVISPTDLGKEIEYEPSEAVGSQVVFELRLGRPSDDNKRYLELHYSNIFHVDDPRARDIKGKFVKDSEKLKEIAADFRHPEAYFEPLQPKKAKQQSATKTKVTQDHFAGL